MTDNKPLQALTVRLPGQVFTPGTGQYEESTTPRNTTARQRPAAVITVHSPDDVASCLQAAGEASLRVVVQATGHGAARDVGADTLLLDTSKLDSVEIDPDRRVVRAGAGATIGAVNAAAFAHGLLAPAGTAPDVGLAGYTVFGGVGWLTRPHGLASASLVSVDLVDAAGHRLHADETQNQDVLWAYRGGGGVGVATAMELRLFPAQDLYGGYLLWPAEHADAVVSAWGHALAELDPALTSSVALLQAPDAPTVPESLRGQRVVHLSAATISGEAAMQTLRRVLSALPRPSIDTLGPCDAERLSGIHLDPPGPVPAVGEGRWLTVEAGALAFDILMAAGADSPLAEVELRHVAASPSSVPGALTSCPSGVLLHATGPGADSDATRRVTAALDTVLAAARPVDIGRSAASFRDGREVAPDALPTEVRARLATIHREIDPANLVAPSRALW